MGRTTVPVRGPDGYGKGKHWVVRGPADDFVTVRLRIVDAHITVKVSSEVKGSKVWESCEGWNRHTYSVVGSWTNAEPVPMVLDTLSPGVFKAYGKLREMYAQEIDGFVEVFKIVVDDD